MKSKELQRLHNLQKKLRGRSRELYSQVMHALFQNHKDYEFVNRLEVLFTEGRFAELLVLADQLSEQQYTDATTHYVANQFALLIKKYPWDPVEVKTDPESVAIRAFFKSERKCFLLNKKFALYDTLRSPNESMLSRMRGFCRYVLGDTPPLEDILDNCAFGSGASIGVHGNATNLARKALAKEWSVTPGAATYAFWGLMRDPFLSNLLFEEKNGTFCLDNEIAKAAFRCRSRIVRNNKISFVLKTAKTHRAIAIEPLLNGFVQKGTDVIMRKMLRRIGVDLSDQSRNQLLAREGSRTDSDDPWVTIDLSSASDSICIGLCRNILPPDWFYFLNSVRSLEFEHKGKRKVYSKFCSMGNGFCFPLESLIFAACCVANGCKVAGTDYSVYGDDIIVRQSKAEGVLKALKAIGFSPNINKTFISGPFRESCGSDWFNGVDVRPYTLDYKLDSLQNLFKWINLTKRNDYTNSFFFGIDPMILDQIPHRFQFFRPFRGNADTGIDALGDEHLTSSTCSFDRRSMTWRCKELKFRAIADRDISGLSPRHATVDMYALLSGSQSRNGKVEYTVRRKTRTSIGTATYGEATSQWLPPSCAVGLWETTHNTRVSPLADL